MEKHVKYFMDNALVLSGSLFPSPSTIHHGSVMKSVSIDELTDSPAHVQFEQQLDKPSHSASMERNF